MTVANRWQCHRRPVSYTHLDVYKRQFKNMEKDLTEVKTMALLIKTEFKSSYNMLNQKVDYLEHRVNIIEQNNFKHSGNEK